MSDCLLHTPLGIHRITIWEMAVKSVVGSLHIELDYYFSVSGRLCWPRQLNMPVSLTRVVFTLLLKQSSLQR